MKLRKLAALVLAGISCIFVSRAAATLFPDLFASGTAAGLHTLVSFAATLVILLFFVTFSRDYVKSSERALDKASNLMIIGWAALSLLFLKELLVVMGSSLFDSVSFDLFLPWINSAITLYFFAVFYGEGLNEERSGLKNALVLVIIGSALSVLIRTALVINFMRGGEFKRMWDFAVRYPVIFLPIQLFIFFASFNFYFTFYRHLRELNR
ncbi:MAG: hypothetical protein R6U43_07380 [Candidatus Krumholzibacteriales bacterium]